ncbi:uncharacterized protein [Nicotiana sylvestris]|uniref:uncharacterized protein n=1 Tax=Nicotiana sylvestris TaxID=4096 RepID=UPI00388CA25F
MDSGCSKHMTGNTTDFLSLKALQGGSVSFGNVKKGYILGVGKVGKSLTHSIENMYYVNRIKYSLLSVSQICEKENKVEFLSKICIVTDLVTGKIVLVAKRYKNIYVADFESLQSGDLSCLKVVDDDAKLWHRRLGHANFSLLNKLIQKDLVHGLPMLQFKTQKVYDACARGKHVKSSFKSKRDVSTSKPLELLHIDLCEPMRVQNRGGKRYIFVIVDDYSRFTWTLFLRTKDETVEDQLGKFDAKSDKGVFLGYSSQSKAYKIYNKRTQCIEESVHVIFYESHPSFEKSAEEDQDGEPLLIIGEVIDMTNGKAPRAWYERLSKFLLENSFKRGKIDNTLFLKKRGRNLLIVHVYVDDIIFGAISDSLYEEFELMGSEFEMSMMRELNFFLGLQVKHPPKGTSICQQKYIRELLKRFDMEASKVIDTPIATATRLDMNEIGSPVNQTMYRGIIGSLLYLTASRPDIVFSVGLYARLQSNPKESHLKAAKRILRYLKGTQDLVLYYLSGNNFNLIGYADADYAGYLVDRKSTSRMAHFLGSCLISWRTRKQNSVALSIAEAEYVVAASCCAQLLWIKQQLEDFGVLTESVPLVCDNTSALNEKSSST